MLLSVFLFFKKIKSRPATVADPVKYTSASEDIDYTDQGQAINTPWLANKDFYHDFLRRIIIICNIYYCNINMSCMINRV